MKTKKITTLLIFLILSIYTFSQDTIRLGLAYPTVLNIKTFENLIETKYIDAPIKIVALCYSHDKYSYALTKDYVKRNKIKNVEFIDITGVLAPSILFRQNSCTEKFYEIFSKTDGIIFPGGDDLPPYVYGETTSIKTNNDNPGRHYFELSLLYHLYGGFQKSNLKPYLEERPNYCILGICLGMQTMSTAAGGTMIQDIPSEVYNCQTYDEALLLDTEKLHRNPWYFIYSDDDIFSCTFHHLIMNDKMSAIFNENPKVPSCHHQAVEKLGKDFEAWAWSTDKKIIEAIQHQKYPNVLGVQFHPEANFLYEKTMAKLTENSKMIDIQTILTENDKKFYKAFWAYITEKLIDSAKNN